MKAMTREQVRRVDPITIDDFGLPGIVLMERASLGLLDGCQRLVGHLQGKSFTIVCGGGNNGGDGYALARHLADADANVTIYATTSDLAGDAKTMADVCRAMQVPIEPATHDAVRDATADVLVDCVLGTGLNDPPRAEIAEVVRAMNHNESTHRLACDVPSGLDCDRGVPLGDASACFRADLTVTFVASKTGFARARRWTGVVVVAPIGAPRAAVRAARG
jgi:NAD(P)H-hydrate epimerase